MKLFCHRIDGRASAGLVDEVANIVEARLLMPWALVQLVKSPLETRLALSDLLKLCAQFGLGLFRGAFASFKLGDAVSEEVIDEFHFRYSSLKRSVLRRQTVV